MTQHNWGGRYRRFVTSCDKWGRIWIKIDLAFILKDRFFRTKNAYKKYTTTLHKVLQRELSKSFYLSNLSILKFCVNTQSILKTKIVVSLWFSIVKITRYSFLFKTGKCSDQFFLRLSEYFLCFVQTQIIRSELYKHLSTSYQSTISSKQHQSIAKLISKGMLFPVYK